MLPNVFSTPMIDPIQSNPVAARRPAIPMAPKDHFSTGHLLTGLKGRAISSGIITAMAQFAGFGLNLVSIMILSRLLNPLDFGLVAMVTTVTGFLRIFNDAGLSTATIQREGITHAQVSNLFWTNVALGAIASLILALSAPVVAWFYREPRLISVTLALCVTFLITSSTVQHLALLKRQMQFKVVALIEVGAMLAGVLVGIGMALLKCGYWSLVGMQLTTPVAAFLLAWSLSHWRPQWPARGSKTRSLLGFGANLTASSFLWSLAKGSDSLLIGRFFGSAALGLYSRAGALLIRPLAQAMSPLEAIFVPTLSRLQGQPERYRRAVFQVFEIVAVTSFLFSGLLLVLAAPVTLVVLGPKWEGAAAILAAFTPVALYTPIVSVAGWLFTSQGRGRDFLVMSVVSSLVTDPVIPGGFAIRSRRCGAELFPFLPVHPDAGSVLHRGPCGPRVDGRIVESILHASAGIRGRLRSDMARAGSGGTSGAPVATRSLWSGGSACRSVLYIPLSSLTAGRGGIVRSGARVEKRAGVGGGLRSAGNLHSTAADPR